MLDAAAEPSPDTQTALTPVTGLFQAPPLDMGACACLMEQYQHKRRRLEMLADLLTGDNLDVVPYFIQGNEQNGRNTHVSSMFTLEPAVRALDAEYWQRTLNLTDLFECMPQPRRDEWNETIYTRTTPPYTPENVHATLESLLTARSNFMAERVDGMFRSLSGDHVTNSPTGFNKRMILNSVFCTFGYANGSRAGTIDDLRKVIAKLRGYDDHFEHSTRAILDLCRKRTGEWHTLDGGALRIRVYMKGTAHLEVHPDVAWRLNLILHQLYPAAIPANQRSKPAKTLKPFACLSRPLPGPVLEVLRNLRMKDNRTVSFGYYSLTNSKVLAEAERVLVSIGGVPSNREVAFDYNARDAIDEIIISGCIADRATHQFYPTPEVLAQAVIGMAGIGPTDSCLEPSAGIGGLADFLPKDRTTCVEISPLHCTVLESKGFATERADFMGWRPERTFDRIVMNPPFSEGRALAHVQAAFQHLAPGGRLVAVMPASFRNKRIVDGAAAIWSEVYANAFAGTSTAVALVALERAA